MHIFNYDFLQDMFLPAPLCKPGGKYRLVALTEATSVATCQRLVLERATMASLTVICVARTTAGKGVPRV